MATGGLRARQAAATRELLIETARQIFTERGYAATSIDDIIKAAGVAKGALYHHFDGKEAVFRAVYQAVEAEAIAGVMAAALAAGEPWTAVRAGLAAFLDACLQPSFRRIVVLESISVIQRDSLDHPDEPDELPMLRAVIAPLVASTVLPGVGTEPLAYVALGGLYGAALFIARSADPPAARLQIDSVLDAILGGLRNARS